MDYTDKVFKTKYGNVTINNSGYYRVTSSKEENQGKLLHRLVWEDFYGCPVPDGYIVHHKNGNKLDNCILNLQLMSDKEHKSLHHKGKIFSKETCNKISTAKTIYELWDTSIVHYSKTTMFKDGNEEGLNPRKCFQYRFKRYGVPIGYFHDFTTVEILHKLVKEAIK